MCWYLLLFLFTAAVDDEHPVMGNLLKLLTKEENDGCGSKIDIFLDFESRFGHWNDCQLTSVVSILS